jgi:hypothetical protein
LGCPFEDGAEVAMQRGGDLAALRAGRERDAFDEGADSFCRLVALLRMPKRFREPFHLVA